MIEPNEDRTRMIMKDKENNKILDICPYFYINKIIKKIPADCEPDDIEIKFFANNALNTMRISMEDYSDTKTLFKQFNKNYFIVYGNNKGPVCTELTRQLEENISKNNFAYEHKILGWYKFNNKDKFLYDKSYLDTNIPTTCIRPCGKFVDGSEKDYDDMLTNYVFNNKNMLLAYILGFTGVVISRISQIQDLGVMIVGLTGTSTTGKTTALKLIASIWGNPDDSQGSLLLRNEASEIGLNSQFSGLFGVPIIFDDLDTNSKINMNDFLYNLSKGTQRVVANTKGECSFKRMGFSGIVIISGENPLLESTSKKLGLYARVTDFSEIPWTKDSDSSNHIKQITNKNYGFKGKVFGEYVQDIPEEDLSTQFDECLQIIKDNIVNHDKFTDRIAKKYAVILQTARLINDCFKVNIDEQDLINLIIDQEGEQQRERDKGKITYEFLYQYFLENKDKFDIYIGDKSYVYQVSPFANKTGIATFKNNEMHLCIAIDKVKEILNNNNFPQITNYKKDWKDFGYTKCEKNRFDMSTSNLGRHYHFVYKNIGIDILGDKK